MLYLTLKKQTPTQVTLGDSTITMYVNANGLTFYDIADKAVIDNFFNTYGIADYYGVDTENERIFLPRNNYFWQFTTDTTKVKEPCLEYSDFMLFCDLKYKKFHKG